MSAAAAAGSAETASVRATTLVFLLVVALCLAQIGWWIWFQVGEADRLARAAEHLRAGDSEGAASVLSASSGRSLEEQAARRRLMFISEGVTLGAAVLAGVVLVYVALLRELRLRRAQERFLAGVTHELKTPLAGLRLGLESLQVGSIRAERHAHYAAAMLDEVGRLELGLGNLLGIAGLAAGRPQPRPGPVDLNGAAAAAVGEWNSRAQAAEVTLRLHEGQPPPTVQADPEALRMVIGNLLDNAIKFTPSGGAVDVRIASARGSAELTVADQGIGVDPADVASVFDRFYRGVNVGHRGGSGLGLHLARELVRAQGGDVTLHSDGIGRGCTVTVRMVETPA